MRLDQKYKDYYAILGVKKDATAKEIKSSYRRLARKYHPDVNPNDQGAEEKFKDLQEAYDILGDEEKRRKYDEYGDQWKHISEGGGPRPGGVGGAGQGPFTYADFGEDAGGFEFTGGGLGDLLSSLFGGRAGGPDSGFGGRTRQRQPRKGDDVTGEISVSLRDAFQGAERSVTMTQPDGARKNLTVRIPRGISDGATLRLGGQGMPGVPGTPNGDLLLTVRVQDPPGYSRKGSDLYVETPLTFPEAALGADKRIPLLDGTSRTLSIPAGVQNGQNIRLRGQGMPQRAHPDRFGDMYVTIKVLVPKSVGVRERELIEELRAVQSGGQAK